MNKHNNCLINCSIDATVISILQNIFLHDENQNVGIGSTFQNVVLWARLPYLGFTTSRYLPPLSPFGDMWMLLKFVNTSAHEYDDTTAGL